MKRSLFLVIGAFFLFLPIFPSHGESAHLPDAEDWVMATRDTEISDLKGLSDKLIIIDYSLDGTDSGQFTSSEIKALQDSDNIVLAWISVGEAEIFRFYWDAEWEIATESAPCYETYDDRYNRKGLTWRNCNEGKRPDWMGPEDTETHGYHVRFWSENWWKIAMKPYLDRVAESGFDGVYLDPQNSISYWMTNTEEKYSREYVTGEFVDLLLKISKYGSRVSDSNDFIVLIEGDPQFFYQKNRKTQGKILGAVEGIVRENGCSKVSGMEERKTTKAEKYFWSKGIMVVGAECE